MGEIKCQSQTFIGGITENTPRSDALSVTDIDGSELLNDVDIANAFTDYFASVVVNSNNLTPTIPSYHIVSPLASISLSEGDVLAAINKLKSNLSAGPDGLPPLLFKRVKHYCTVNICVQTTCVCRVCARRVEKCSYNPCSQERIH